MSVALLETGVVYGIPIAALVGWYVRALKKREKESQAVKEEAEASGLTEPASLHPVIDESQCIGCGACVLACPENDVLGILNGKAELVGPSHCIGHGACAGACPVSAISLVFGTEKRGVDIPFVAPDFETNVPGVFVAGELGGMGLIRNAITQGRQAMESIAERLKSMASAPTPTGTLDAIIIGAGPAGFAAALAAMERDLKAVTLEQETFGGTVAHYPRGKVVMTAPVDLPIVGKTRFGETTKEHLLEFWESVRAETNPDIRYSERVSRIEALDGGLFRVRTESAEYFGRAVLLAIGRRGTPRKLEVPGEEQNKVVYRLTDPEQYRGKAVLVVGGGDSALEATLALAGESGTRVSLSYRGDAFGRAKPKNRERIASASADGTVDVFLESSVSRIEDGSVILDCGGSTKEFSNDAIIVCAGGILPTAFLKDIGVDVQTKHGTK